MKVKHDAEADILIFILQDDLPYDAISGQSGVIVSYKRFKVMAARGNVQEGLRILDKLDAER